MRKLNWDEALSDEDVAWLRTTGQPGMEERIVAHQAQFDAQVPEEEVLGDEVSKSALDPSARLGDPAATGDGPLFVDPTQNDEVIEDIEGDDYENWPKADLEAEVKARNELPDTTEVSVDGTGKDSAVLKADLVKGLRLWDQENPGAL